MISMARSSRRRGQTVTFSVSVDAHTKKLLREMAERSYGGNVSELVSQIAQQAARRDAAGELLALHGRPPMTDEECSAFEAEIAGRLAGRPASRRRRRRAA